MWCDNPDVVIIGSMGFVRFGSVIYVRIFQRPYIGAELGFRTRRESVRRKEARRKDSDEFGSSVS